MRTAPALALFTVGAILAYAVDVSVPVVDIQVVGTVLTLAGLLWLAVEIALEVAAMRRRRPRRERAPAPAPEHAPQETTYDPVIRSRPGDDPGRRTERPARGSDADVTRVMSRRRG